MRVRAVILVSIALAVAMEVGCSTATATATAAAALPAPEPLAVTPAQRFVSDVDPFDLPWVLQLSLPAVPGAAAYEIRCPDAGWSFRCEPVQSPSPTETPAIPVVNGVPLELHWWEGGGAWALPLGPVPTTTGGTAVLFPPGENRVEVRALPALDSPATEAGPAASITFRWYEQTTLSSIGVRPTPWGLNISRGTTSAGAQFTGAKPGGRLEASKDGRRWYAVEQYSQSASARTWSAAESAVIAADPTVWPRHGLVLPNGLTYGRFRYGATSLRPLADAVWYRHSFPGEIDEVAAGTFVRFKASVASYRYAPRPSPSLRPVSMTTVKARRTTTWRSTIGSRAAAKAPVRWRLYERASTATSQTPPAQAWLLRKTGTATYSAATASTRAYTVRFAAARKGAWRLDVTYGGSSVARPDGYSKTFIVR